MRRVLTIAAFTLLAACTPPTNTPSGDADPSAPVVNADASTDPLAIAAAATISDEIGVPIALSPTVSRTEGDWGWLIAQPWTPEGAAIDWSQTRYAQRASEGVLDGQGTTYVLLKRETGQWHVEAFAVGPTDVAWADWPQRYGAPESLFATE